MITNRALTLVPALTLVLAALLPVVAWAGELSPGAEGCALVQELAQEVADRRGLALLAPVECRELSRADYLAHKQREYLFDENSDRLQAEEIAYKQIGLIPETYPYLSCIAESYTENLIASYDSAKRAILLPIGTRLDRSVLVHELVHALQDQHFPLAPRQARANRATDSALAFAALVEGDALLVQDQFLAPEVTTPKTDQPLLPTRCASPLGLELQFDFPYGYGSMYARRLVRQGGNAAIDQRLKDPAQCTAAIMHSGVSPEQCTKSPRLALDHSDRSWINRQIGPAVRERFVESLGEYTLGLLLAPRYSRKQSIDAARGWSGDRLTLWRGQNGNATSVVTEWETAERAGRFAEALIRVLETRFGVALRLAARVLDFESGGKAVRVSIQGSRVTALFYFPQIS